MKLNKLTEEEQAVIIGKQTEVPFSGEYDEFSKKECIFVGNAIIRFILRRQNSNLAAAGLALMTK